MLGRKFGIGGAHLCDKNRDEPVDEGLFLVEEGIGIAHGAAQDAADDIASLGIARQLAVSDAEGDGTQMVGDDAHGHVGIFLLAILHARKIFYLADDGLENIGVVVGCLALNGAYEALEAHAGVDDIHRQFLQ